MSCAWLLDQVVFPVVLIDLELGDGGVEHRYAGAVDAVGIARDQRVPVVKRLAVMEQLVGAGLGHPVEMAFEGLGGQRDAFRDKLVADVILRAPAGAVIEQTARDAGQRHFSGVVILELVEAACAAAIAQRLPFKAGHARQRRGFPIARRKAAAVDRIVAHGCPRMSRARAQSASICAMKASRLSKVSSGRRYSTSATDISAP